MKLGFIGYGNMASAIIAGVVSAGLVSQQDIFVVEKDPEKQSSAVAMGFQATDAEFLNNVVDLIFICVKPKDFSGLLHQIRPEIGGRVTFVSIAAGITLEAMEAVLGSSTPIVRVMPNTPILIGQGTTAICRNGHVDDALYTFVHQVFAGAGTVYDIDEVYFNEVLNLNGSAPAYVYLFAKTIAEYAAAHGIEYAVALNMLSDTLKGAASMLQHSGKPAGELIKNVSSPGGTTVAALEAMEANGFTNSLRKGCSACVIRAEQLGKTQ